MNVMRLAEAESTLQAATARKMEIPDLLQTQFAIAFLKGDQAAMDRAVAQARGKPASEDLLIDTEGIAASYFGRVRESRNKTRQAIELATAEHTERAAQYEMGQAVREAFLGNLNEARRGAESALSAAKGRDEKYGSGLVLALSGDAKSQAVADELEKAFPEDTFVRFSYAPVLRALYAVKHGEGAKAVEALKITAAYESGLVGNFVGCYGSLYPIYARGEAHLALGQGAEAAVEFQKIINLRGVALLDPIISLARWRLGKALALAGDKTKAKAAYEKFFDLWKGADPDGPLLKEAKAEYAKL
jgi:tetratricopeptide (TPR) repeat protein